MQIFVNGDACQVQAPSLAGVLDELGYGGRLVATAVNGDFVAAVARTQCQLVEGDRLEIIAPIQGG